MKTKKAIMTFFAGLCPLVASATESRVDSDMQTTSNDSSFFFGIFLSVSVVAAIAFLWMLSRARSQLAEPEYQQNEADHPRLPSLEKVAIKRLNDHLSYLSQLSPMETVKLAMDSELEELYTRVVREEDVPSNFKCPITKSIMVDPVVLPDGRSYERKAIQQWFNAGQDSCPLTPSIKIKQSPDILPTNIALQQNIARFVLNYLEQKEHPSCPPHVRA